MYREGYFANFWRTSSLRLVSFRMIYFMSGYIHIHLFFKIGVFLSFWFGGLGFGSGRVRGLGVREVTEGVLRR